MSLSDKIRKLYPHDIPKETVKEFIQKILEFAEEVRGEDGDVLMILNKIKEKAGDKLI